tara:strand:- start:1176 stop:1349 length:174 start_codon:yes stop_codon:yes gene_type:complete
MPTLFWNAASEFNTFKRIKTLTTKEEIVLLRKQILEMERYIQMLQELLSTKMQIIFV